MISRGLRLDGLVFCWCRDVEGGGWKVLGGTGLGFRLLTGGLIIGWLCGANYLLAGDGLLF